MKTNFETYAQLYKTHIDELYSYGLSLGHTEAICMDAIHDVFCKLIAKDADIETIDNPKFYLFRSMKNRLLDMLKHDNKMLYSDRNFPTDLSVEDDSLVTSQERELLTARVKHLMDQLTPTQREAIYLRYMQEMEYDQIAILLQITPESVRKLIHRGVKRLRQQNLGLLGYMLIMYLLK